MARRNRVLVWCLRAYAAMLIAAMPAALLPTSFLAAAHQWLGFGPWPADVPLFESLARSASALYASLGGLALMASFDVERHRSVILCLGLLGLSGAGYLAVMGWLVGMPLWWVAVEGPTVLLTGLLLLALCRRS